MSLSPQKLCYKKINCICEHCKEKRDEKASFLNLHVNCHIFMYKKYGIRQENLYLDRVL
jgi:hypothetical protein